MDMVWVTCNLFDFAATSPLLVLSPSSWGMDCFSNVPQLYFVLTSWTVLNDGTAYQPRHTEEARPHACYCSGNDHSMLLAPKAVG